VTAPVTVDRSSYEAAVAALRAQLVAYLGQFWVTADLTDFTIQQLTQIVAPAVEAAQLQIANLTSVYMAAATVSEPLPVADSVLTGRGVSPDVVYARPVIQARTMVSKGETIVDAMKAGQRRLESIATTDLQMAKIRQAQSSLKHGGKTHYRRVLKGTHNCAMCIIASTQRYYTAKLMPIHPGCDCDVEPLERGRDLVIDGRLLEAAHQKVKDITGISDRGGREPDYRKLLVINQHGELGDVLTWRGQKFTSLDQLKD